MNNKKVIISIISIVLILVMSTTSANGATARKYGDVDGNGVVDINDVSTFQLTLLGILEPTEAFNRNSNTYTDQKTSIRDVTVIQLYLVGRFRKLPITPDGYYAEILIP